MVAPTGDLRSKVLGLTGRRYSPKIYIPGLGNFVARNMTELERAAVEAGMGDRTAVKRLVVINSICDWESKELVFRSEDFEALGGVDSAVIDRLCSAALKLNNFSEEDIRTLLGEPASS